MKARKRGDAQFINWIIVLGVVVLSAPALAEETPAFTTQKEKMSYVIGVDMARDFKRQGFDCDPDFVVKGLREGLAGQKLPMSEGDFRQTLVEIQNSMRMRQALTRGKSQAEINKKRGEFFLAENKEKEGVVTLPSGLQYKILKEGDGLKPTDNDTLECNYRGTLLDGTEFSGSRPGQPGIMKVVGGIAGLTEGLKLMPVGSKWQFFIPPGLAYGVQGVGRDIGPNEAIIYEVELVGIKSQESTAL
jgi:FKBP-type peptidyl-prolyl cis-trans isomerase